MIEYIRRGVMIMKNKKLMNIIIGCSIFIAIAIIVTIGYFFPFPINIPCEETGYMVVVQKIDDTWLEDEGYLETDVISTSYLFEKDSKEAQKLQELLSGYSYHRTLATIFTSNDQSYLSGNDFDCVIMINSGEEWLSTNGTEEIIINGKLYGIGYFSDDDARSLQTELEDFLGTCESVQ